jgi:homoserine dehydrogenase
MAEPVRCLLVGLGHVGRTFLELALRKGAVLRERYGLALSLTGVADRSGAAVDPKGLDLQEVLARKQAGQGAGTYPGGGQPGRSALEMVRAAAADLLLEASPANLVDGQPGLGCLEAALERGMHAVTANKAPLVLAYPRLLALARERGVGLRFDATVAGGLPAVNLGQRDLVAADIERLEGVLNLTAHSILVRMAEEGLSYDQALAQAQAAGHAESDPSLDVEGWDAANKLLILAQSVLGYPARREEVAVEGITAITAGMLAEAARQGRRVRLVARAERAGAGYRLAVGPAWLEADHPLARLGAEQMGIVYHTDIYGQIVASIVEQTPLPTAAAMLRDLVALYRGG